MGDFFSSSSFTSPLVRTGLDVLVSQNFSVFRSKNIGIVSNASAVNSEMIHLVDLITEIENVNVVALFAPEHGFFATSQAGKGENFKKHAQTGIAIYDIYGKSGKSLAKIFEDSKIEVLLFDIQDIGARFYTYIWTLYDCMVACATSAKFTKDKRFKIVVCDRPNPIGGLTTDGPLLSSSFSSFVGRKPIVLQHGMTIGELALLFNQEFIFQEMKKKINVEVVKLEGWKRSFLFSDTGLLWVSPSPNIPSPISALLYPGMCLLEGTNCSEGRGTTLPFELMGAPWIANCELVKYLHNSNCSGVLFRATSFSPTFGKFANQTAYGMQVHVVEPKAVQPVRLGFSILVALKALYPKDFCWRCDNGSFWIDRLLGSSLYREAIDAGATVDEIQAFWQEDLIWFRALRERYLLYPQ